MNAQEAREQAMSVTQGRNQVQYAEVMSLVKNAVENGYFTTNYYKPLLPAVETELEKEGYKVTSYSDQRDGTTVTISW